jgi:superfamily II DNA or RNA helicase
MSYFADNYSVLRYPLAVGDAPGFRPAQLAAIHAISAHFFGSQEPALITMPTGSGKTTVLLAAAFVLRANRVLVVTPSRLVREQIAENFGSLSDLIKAGAVATNAAGPKVHMVDGVVDSADKWDALRDFDVVVSTVTAISPGAGAAEAPKDLFDVILVDEAHHSPAKTWASLLNHFRDAKQALFTATPFRRDEKEIKAKFVFTYDLRRAYADGVFGEIQFQPVSLEGSPSIDVAIARKAQAVFDADRAAGLQHLVMVRTDSVSRGKELLQLYADHTTLRMAFVHGGHTLKHVRKVVQQLKDSELDGIVCVNMFGEGFNLPALKIAAVHSPHKSLAVTLQFIGRFARTAATVGRAVFIAEPASSSEELGNLYEEGAVWRDIVQDLSLARVESERHAREVLDSFSVTAAPDMKDFSLYTVNPFVHAKIYRVGADLDLTNEPDFPGLQIIFTGESDTHGAVVYITREEVRPAWASDDRFSNVEYDIFVLHHNKASGLLFISASRRHVALYEMIAKTVASDPRRLSNSAVSKALQGLEGAEFFSVGMRKRNLLGASETYRTLTGSSADRSLLASDARLFDRGHCFGKGMEGGAAVTIGVSASSKVWSNQYSRIPDLLDWCDRVAAKIAGAAPTVTGTRLDHLPCGEDLTEIPAGVIGMTLAHDTFLNPVLAEYYLEGGEVRRAQLLDFDLTIVESLAARVVFALKNEDIEWQGTLSLDGARLITNVGEQPEMYVVSGSHEIPLLDYLNECVPTFYCADLSSLDGVSLFKGPENLVPFADAQFEIVDWAAAGVDIQTEKPTPGRVSIFEWLEHRLLASTATVVFCDDGAGEIADFIAISEEGTGVVVRMYHCKASGARAAGSRVEDLYDVCGQVIKACSWIKPTELMARFEHRVTRPSIRGFLKGTDGDARHLLTSRLNQQIRFEMWIVQPGVARNGRSAAVSNLLAAAAEWLRGAGVEDVRVIAS